MTTPSSSPDETPATARPDQPHRRPRWVTATVVVGLVLVLAFVVLHLTGGGMGGHLPDGGH